MIASATDSARAPVFGERPFTREPELTSTLYCTACIRTYILRVRPLQGVSNQSAIAHWIDRATHCPVCGAPATRL